MGPERRVFHGQWRGSGSVEPTGRTRGAPASRHGDGPGSTSPEARNSGRAGLSQQVLGGHRVLDGLGHRVGAQDPDVPLPHHPPAFMK